MRNTLNSVLFRLSLIVVLAIASIFVFNIHNTYYRDTIYISLRLVLFFGLLIYIASFVSSAIKANKNIFLWAFAGFLVFVLSLAPVVLLTFLVPLEFQKRLGDIGMFSILVVSLLLCYFISLFYLEKRLKEQLHNPPAWLLILLLVVFVLGFKLYQGPLHAQAFVLNKKCETLFSKVNNILETNSGTERINELLNYEKPVMDLRKNMAIAGDKYGWLFPTTINNENYNRYRENISALDSRMHIENEITTKRLIKLGWVCNRVAPPYVTQHFNTPNDDDPYNRRLIGINSDQYLELVKSLETPAEGMAGIALGMELGFIR